MKKNQSSRIDWYDYAIELAYVAAKRSEDPYQKVGSVALRHDHTLIGTGYNGPPSGIDIEWDNREERRNFVIHSEINCLNNVKPNEAKFLAVTLSPCVDCLKTIAVKKIPLVIYSEIYTTDSETYKKTLKVAEIFKIKLLHIPKNEN